MDSIIKKTDGKYKEYEAMLLERDKCLKYAQLCQQRYIHEFGELITEIFRRKISCIEKKKIIALCQIFINRREPINLDAVKEQISAEMTEYQEQLNELIEENERCKDLRIISDKDLLKIKKLYRQIARQIHPDLNPITADSAILSDLWNRVSSAYRCNNLQELEELSVLIKATLNSMDNKFEVNIPNIEEKIKNLIAEIEKIKTTEPYIYENVLKSPSSIRTKRAELQEELDSYINYEKELQDIINQLTDKEITFTWKPIN